MNHEFCTSERIKRDLLVSGSCLIRKFVASFLDHTDYQAQNVPISPEQRM
jgi:hypothetical protein